MSQYGAELEQGYWCEHEGIYYTDPEEHPKVLLGVPEGAFDKIEDSGHFGYVCRGAMDPPIRAAIVVLCDEVGEE